MGSSEFLFENARSEFKKVLSKDIADNNMESLPQFVRFCNNYTGSEAEKKTAVDQILRDLVRDKISDKNISEAPGAITTLLHIITASVSVAKQGLCSPSIPFILLGDVLDCFTLDACDVVFKYIEERVSVWKSSLFYTAGKNYLLRMCNDLLRRLSQSINTVFCGRIQLFLARLFPLSEKSALNLVSQFNLENVTVFNKDLESTTLKKETAENGYSGEKMEVDSKPEEEGSPATFQSTVVDYKLYQNIWSLQDIFRYPVQCYTKDTWGKFTENAECVFRIFSSFKLEDVGRGSKSSSTQSKRNYFPKFLTSEKLTELQLNDGMFRRQILIQFLILFRYLTANVKFKGANLVLTDNMKSWISESEPKIYELLKETPPDGRHFAKYIRHLLDREEFWIAWKNDGCPSFMKTPAKTQQNTKQDGSPSSKRRKTGEPSIVEEFISGNNLGMGSAELTRLWNLHPDNLAACRSTSREFLPSLQDYFMECIEQAGPKNTVEEQHKLVKKSNFQWKALRLLSHRSHLFFTSQPAQMQFKAVPDYLNTVMSKLAKDFPTPPAEIALKPEEDTEDLSQDEDLKDEGSDNKDDDVLGEADNDEDIGEDEDDSNLLDDNTPEQNSNASDKLSSEDISNLAAKLSQNWKKLAPLLNLKPKDIKEIQEDSDDVALQARQTLVTWQDSAKQQATRTTLAQALKSADLENLAQDIK
ncbi:unnamed protein product [Clavelina lepadiformis]|uniref:Death domain-containing protein n=1 Tax=Clavelina lepadiformis TaxID=159417 RepID=A0ABP0F1P0_CLALP